MLLAGKEFKTSASKFMFAKPPHEMLSHFSEMLSPMFELIHETTLKSANLRKTRYLLLPRLISGELDVEGLDINTDISNGH